MKKSKFSEDQIVRILQDAEAGGLTHAELCKKHGVNLNTFYIWRRKYSGMQTGDVRRMRELEAENAALKGIVADQALEIDATRKLLRKNGFPPPNVGRGRIS
ncbi:MAG: transposase [Fimbriimonadaceae bacterium]